MCVWLYVVRLPGSSARSHGPNRFQRVFTSQQSISEAVAPVNAVFINLRHRHHGDDGTCHWDLSDQLVAASGGYDKKNPLWLHKQRPPPAVIECAIKFRLIMNHSISEDSRNWRDDCHKRWYWTSQPCRMEYNLDVTEGDTCRKKTLTKTSVKKYNWN